MFLPFHSGLGRKIPTSFLIAGLLNLTYVLSASFDGKQVIKTVSISTFCLHAIVDCFGGQGYNLFFSPGQSYFSAEVYLLEYTPLLLGAECWCHGQSTANLNETLDVTSFASPHSCSFLFAALFFLSRVCFSTLLLLTSTSTTFLFRISWKHSFRTLLHCILARLLVCVFIWRNGKYRSPLCFSSGLSKIFCNCSSLVHSTEIELQ